jgi:TPR repeat protein
VGENLAQSVRWYRAAAAQGHAVAQFLLSLGYEAGLGLVHFSAQQHRHLS